MFIEMSVRLFGGIIEPYLDYFDPLEVKMKSASIKMSLKEYLSITLISSLIAFIVSMPIVSFIFSFITERAIFSYTLGIIISFSLLSSGRCSFP